MELSIGLAFIAGLVSFISPCVLPLVPAYIGYMGGRVTNTVATSMRAGAGAGGGTITSETPLSQRFSTALHGLFFVAGFTAVFVVIGLLSTAFIQVIGGSVTNITDVIGRIGGIVIVFFGLHFMGALRKFFTWLRQQDGLLNNIGLSLLFALLGSWLLLWGFTGVLIPNQLLSWQGALWMPIIAGVLVAIFLVWMIMKGAFNTPGEFWNNTLNGIELALYTDTRKQLNMGSGNQGYGGSAVMGVVFAAGWTPCIGPVYGAVLTMAANGGDVSVAGGMLTAYALGLGVPFLATALLLDQAQGVLRRLQQRMATIELVSGVFLIIVGLAVATGSLQRLSEQFAGDFAEFSIGVEESVLQAVTGSEEIAFDATGSDNTVETIAEGPDTSIAAPEINGDADDVAEVGQVGSITGLAAAGDATIEAEPSTADLEVGLNVGNLAPDFQTTLPNGEPIALTDLRGETVLLNFWATWCGPCRIEMPEFQAQFDALNDDGFTILAVNNSEDAETVEEFREAFGLTFPLAMDERGDIQAQYGIFSYPSTFIVDENGVITAKHFGALTTSQIDELIADNFAS